MNKTLLCNALDGMYGSFTCGKDAQHLCADCGLGVCIGCSDPCYDCGQHLHPECRDFHAKETLHVIDAPKKPLYGQLIDREVDRVCAIVDSAAVKALAMVLLFASLSFGQTIQHGVQLACTQSGTGTATFSVYRATASHAEAKPPLASGLTSCSYFDSSIVAGTTYYYTVTETVGGVESGPSTEVSAQTLVPPNAPTNPSATIQ